MLALEHLQANALLVVLIGAALALVTLRAVVHLCQRAVVARDRATIASLTRQHDDPLQP